MVKNELEKTYTVEEYLALEAQSEVRHEFFYGNLFETPGTTFLHNQICMLLWIILKNQLSKEDYSVGTESVKIKIKDEDIYLYPDVFVSKKVANPQHTIVINDPVLIIEVLSDSTRRYDSTDKFIQYRKIDSLEYYLLVEPEKQVVIFYEKAADGNWVAKTYIDDDEVVNLPKLSATMRIGDIYAK